MRRNPNLVAGIALLALLVVVGLGGHLVIDPMDAEPLSAPAKRPPSWAYPLGTDTQGRDLLAVMVVGIGLTLKIGALAGTLGLTIGASLGFFAGYCGGWIDAVISFVVDVLLTVPVLLFLVVITANLPSGLNTTEMALIIALFTWRQPARQIRSQVLIMREMGYVLTARLAGRGTLGIVFAELLPNLLPYLASSFVLVTSIAILSSIGLEALGLGPQNESTLGMMIYWLMFESALMLGLWWWLLTPVTILIVLFVGLYLVSVGLDEIANPRLRGRAAER
ncbi:MAG: ABC transporter permease [Proteobacteria bacterium]|nr:ABC transporter permease [Pseudomonadota bacterium]